MRRIVRVLLAMLVVGFAFCVAPRAAAAADSPDAAAAIGEDFPVVRTARVGDRTFVVAGARSGDDEPVVLFRLAPDLSVEARLEIGHGAMPSIDGDPATGLVVLGFFEERPPNAAPEGRVIVLSPPTNVMHVQVRAASTLALVGSRIFRGADGSLLSPHAMPDRAAHAVAIYGGTVVLALPLRRSCRIVTAKLPLLEVQGDRSLAWPLEPFASFTLHHAGRGIVAVGGDHDVATPVAGRPSRFQRTTTE